MALPAAEEFHRHLDSRATLDYAPLLRREGLRGGLLYHDAMEDDARLALAVLRTALDRGATAVTRVRATGAIREQGRLDGIRATDLIGDTPLEIRASSVIDATGVWASRPEGPFGAGSAAVAPSRGSHIIVSRERLPVRGGITLRVPGKVVFLVPWPRHWIIGTTDLPDDGPVDRPQATAAEVNSIIDTVNRAMAVELTRADVVGTYAGLRPLVAPAGTRATTSVSRHHRVTRDPDGLVHVSGGKYTTYRVMGRDAVDAALGKDAKHRPSTTADLPLHGSVVLADIPTTAAAIAREHSLSGEIATALVDRHGTDAPAVARLGRELDLLRPLANGFPYIEAEVAWAARHELALDLDDVLARRTRLVQELPDRGESILPRIAAIMSRELGWDAARCEREAATFLARAQREFGLPEPTGDPPA